MRCPPIPFTASEQRREAFLWRLATAFQEEMDKQQNPCVLKGGTALRFRLQLARPSSDLDFEGERPVSVRKTLLKAVAAIGSTEQCRIGRDILWRGTITMNLRDPEAGWIRSAVDYRRTGSRPGMPDNVPLNQCERLGKINIYRADELISRKLQTLIGERPRQKARDIYDAAWIVSREAGLVRGTDAAKLAQWLKRITSEKRQQLQQRLQQEELTKRVDKSEVWEALESGVRGLSQNRHEPSARRSRETNRTAPALGQSPEADNKLPAGAPVRPVTKIPDKSERDHSRQR